MNREGIIVTLLCAGFAIAGNLMMRQATRAGQLFDIAPAAILGSIGRLLTDPVALTAMIFYGAAALMWFRILATQNIAVAYPLIVGTTILFQSLAGIVLLHEKVQASQALGIALVFVGVGLISRT